MPLIPVDHSHIVDAVVGDAQYLRSVISWAKQRYDAYNTVCTVDVMTAASIPSGDQAFILAFIGDLNRILQLSSGTVPENADNMSYNITHLLGLT